MFDLAADLCAVLHTGEPVAVVTVARVARSAPRGAGAAMALTRGGRIIGSISGGCVESDAVLLATEVLATGIGRRASLGFSDEAAHAAGLACGGSVEVIVHRIDPADAVALEVLEAVARDAPARAGVVLSGPDAGRILAADALPRTVDETGIVGADADVLALVHHPRRRLVIIGAGDHAMALARVGHAAGFTVAVCDVWERLVTPERFPTAQRLIAGLPVEHLGELLGAEPDRAAVCVLTHDERVDVPAIVAALRLEAGFVGAMGARGTVAHRRALLIAAGLDDGELARLHSPLGLDLGGASPEEAALAALAEIVAAHHGASAAPLRDGTGPLHRRTSDMPAEACDVSGAVARA